MNAQIELIKWVDTFGCPAGWQFEDEIETDITSVQSVGFVIIENENSLVLAPHVSDSSRRQLAGYITIPCQQIISRQVIFSSVSTASCLEPVLEQNPQDSLLFS